MDDWAVGDCDIGGSVTVLFAGGWFVGIFLDLYSFRTFVKLSYCLLIFGAHSKMRIASLIYSFCLLSAWDIIEMLSKIWDLVGVTFWQSKKCLLILPVWACIVILLLIVVVVKPM